MNLLDEFFKIMREVQFVPPDGKAKSPCSKCIGLQAGCTIKMTRNPDVECGAFHDKDKPIIIAKREPK